MLTANGASARYPQALDFRVSVTWHSRGSSETAVKAVTVAPWGVTVAVGASDDGDATCELAEDVSKSTRIHVGAPCEAGGVGAASAGGGGADDRAGSEDERTAIAASGDPLSGLTIRIAPDGFDRPLLPEEVFPMHTGAEVPNWTGWEGCEGRWSTPIGTAPRDWDEAENVVSNAYFPHDLMPLSAGSEPI